MNIPTPAPGASPRSRPSFGSAELRAARWLIARAVDEDLSAGDVTTDALFPVESGHGGGPAARAAFVARAEGVLCGLPVAREVFRLHAPGVSPSRSLQDGDRLVPDQVFLEVSGPARSILRLERIVLNFVGRLSGIATATDRWCQRISGSGAKLYDTRKTTPGWRTLEKYAVRAGGGENHRRGLGDAILLKDNHAAALRSAGRWEIGACARALRRAAPGAFLEVEVEGRDALLQALAADVDAILLDNFSLEDLRWAVAARNERGRPMAGGARRPLLEASGGIRLETLEAVAETGVERISAGALTHSAISLDVALDFRVD